MKGCPVLGLEPGAGCFCVWCWEPVACGVYARGQLFWGLPGASYVWFGAGGQLLLWFDAGVEGLFQRPVGWVLGQKPAMPHFKPVGLWMLHPGDDVRAVGLIGARGIGLVHDFSPKSRLTH